MKKRELAVMVSLLVLIPSLAFAAGERDTQIRRTVLEVQKLTCGACLSRIESALSPMKGFSAMRSNLWRKLIAVDATAFLSSDQIAEAITAIGYPAQIISVTDIDNNEAFTSQSNTARSGGGGCCSSPQAQGYGTSDYGAGGEPAAQTNPASCCSTDNPQDRSATLDSGCSSTGEGCGYSTSKRGCGASSEAWKAVIQHYFKAQKQLNNNSSAEAQPKTN